MHYQYPLETLARKRGTVSQLEFAQQARGALFDSDEAIFEAHGHGLAIFAANEDAIEQPARILREIYGPAVEIRRPKVRVMPGEPPHEPIAQVRVTTGSRFALAVVAELQRRDARILEKCERRRVFVVRAKAPLAALLGLPAALHAIAGDEAVHSIRLLGYAPLEPAPPPVAA